MFIMLAVRQVKALGGITILTAKQATIIHANIFAHHASTLFALRGIFFRRHLDAKHPPDILIVDALAGADSKLS